MTAHSTPRICLRLLLSLALLSLTLAPPAPSRAAPTPPPPASPGVISGVPGVAEKRAVVSWDDIVRQDRQRQAAAGRPYETPWQGESPAPDPAPLPAADLPPALAAAGSLQPAAPETASPPLAASFAALGDNSAVIPPDTHGSPGPNHLMTTLNTEVRMQTRSGTVLSTAGLNTFWSKVNGTAGAFDPRVLYDPYGQRWIVVACDDAATTTSGLLIGASQTSDPTGLWNLYRVKASDTNWIDYPSVGFNKNWVAVSVNIYTTGGSYVRKEIYAFDKAGLYENIEKAEAAHQRLSDSSSGGTWAPAVTYDNSLEQLYLLQVYSSDAGQVRLGMISGPVGAPTFSTAITGWMVFSGSGWSQQSNASRTDFAPQLGSAQKIQTNDARMQNVVYRNGSLWATHTIFLPAGGAPTRSSVQWWQIAPNNPPATPPGIVQSGRVDDPSGVNFYAFPSIAVNQNSDLLLGYSRFSASQYASGNYAFRAASDPPGTLRTDTVMKAGEAPYYKVFSSLRNRWGDYSHTYVDPVNDRDFWTIQEYAAPHLDGYDRWGTWWGKLVPPPTPFGKSAPADGAANQNPALQLSWTASSMSGGGYEYCLDTTNNSACDTAWTSTLTATQVSPPGLGGGQTYYWQVRAATAGGTTIADSGAWWSFTTLPDPPATFAKTAPGNGATGVSTSPLLSWGASNGAVKYEYCLDTTPGSVCDSAWISTTLNTSVQISGLQNLTTYYWQARAVNSVGTTEADGGQWRSFTTAAMPGGFSKTLPGDGVTGQAKNPLLTWGASSGAAAYQYCVDQVNDGACTTTWITVTGSTSAQLAGLQQGTLYYWQVRANSPGGTVYANGGVWWSFRTVYDPPGAFNKSSPGNSSTLQPASLTLQWGASAGALSYEYCLDDSANSVCNTTWISTGLSTSKLVSGLDPLKLYSWQVRATNLGGTVLANSGTWWSFTTEDTPAGAFSKLYPASAQLDLPLTLSLTWSASSGALSYQYCLDTTNDSACSGSWISAGTQLSVTVSGLKYGTLYYWQVRALKTNTNPTQASGGSWWQFRTGYYKIYMPLIRMRK